MWSIDRVDPCKLADPPSYQIHQCDVEENSSCQSKNPVVSTFVGCPDSHAHKESQNCRQCRDKVETNGGIPTHASGEEHKEIP